MLKRLRNRDKNSNLESEINYLHTAQHITTMQNIKQSNKLNLYQKSNAICSKSYLDDEKPIIRVNKKPFALNTNFRSLENQENKINQIALLQATNVKIGNL